MRIYATMLCLGALLLSVRSESYEAVAVKGGGSVKGAVTFKGELPKPKKVAVLKDEDVCGKGERTVNPVEVSKNGGLANAIVFIRGITKGKAWPKQKKPYLLDQDGCRFLPEVAIVPKGENLDITNSDPVAHNVHTYELIGRSRRSMFNLAQPKPGKLTKPLKLRGRGNAVKVECDVHNFMHSWVFVADSPYYSVTDREGRFSLSGVPPGEYKLRAWHPVLGKRGGKAVVTSGKTSSVTIEWVRKTRAKK